MAIYRITLGGGLSEGIQLLHTWVYIGTIWHSNLKWLQDIFVQLKIYTTGTSFKVLSEIYFLSCRGKQVLTLDKMFQGHPLVVKVGKTYLNPY